MKIDEAIDMLKSILKDRRPYEGGPGNDAIKLGIEALKHYQDSSHFACGCLLPGQTEERK